MIERGKHNLMHTLSRPLNSQSSLGIFADEEKAAWNKPAWSKRVGSKALVTKSQLKPNLDLKLPKMSLF